MKSLFIFLIYLCLGCSQLFSQCYQLYWADNYGTGYYGYLNVYQNGSAEMTVKYSNPQGGGGCIYEVGRLVNYGNYYGVEFYNPKVCGTNSLSGSYSADNIHWAYDQYGRLYVYAIDDMASSSGAWIKQVYCN